MAFNAGFDEVTIANMALSKIGARSTISSMQENSAVGQQVRLWFTTARAQTLAAHDWSFARKRARLPESSDTPGTDMLWEFRYLYITDSLVFRLIENPAGKDADAVPFETEFDANGNKSILTNVEDAIGFFTVDVTETLKFPPLFIEAYATCLAWHLAMPLTGSREIATDMANQFRYLIAVAAAQDANESVKTPPRDAEWIRNR